MAEVYGVTTEGFVRPTFETLRSELEAEIREVLGQAYEIDPYDPLGAGYLAQLDQWDSAWEAAEYAYNAHDGENADDNAQVALAALFGVFREGTKSGLARCTLVFEGPFPRGPYLAGALQCHPENRPEALWSNRDFIPEHSELEMTNMVFQSNLPGSRAVAPAGTLNTIAQPIPGWVSVTNPTSAIPGKEIETIEALKLRRKQALGRMGSATGIGIRADVAAVPGVIAVKVYSNKKTKPVDAFGVPYLSIHVIVWDGEIPAANNNDIAQAMMGTVAEGAGLHGEESGEAIDANDDGVEMNFDRASQQPVYMQITVFAPFGADEDEVKDALIARVPTSEIGARLPYAGMNCAALAEHGGASGVQDVLSFRMGFTDPGTGQVSLQADRTSVITIHPDNILVTIQTEE